MLFWIVTKHFRLDMYYFLLTRGNDTWHGRTASNTKHAMKVIYEEISFLETLVTRLSFSSVCKSDTLLTLKYWLLTLF